MYPNVPTHRETLTLPYYVIKNRHSQREPHNVQVVSEHYADGGGGG